MNLTSIINRSLFALAGSTIVGSTALAQTIIEYSGSPARVIGNVSSMQETTNYARDDAMPTFISSNGENCVAIRGSNQVTLDLVPPCTIVKYGNKNHKSFNQNRILFYVLGQQKNNPALVNLADENDAFSNICQNNEAAGNRIQSVFIESNNQIKLDEAVNFEPICASMALQHILQ